MKKQLTLTVSALCLSAMAVATEQKPNVIFILADDLAWSDVGYKNGSKDYYQTPNIDNISAQGMRFDCFYPGGSNSAPSRANIITGMSNVRSKIYTPGGMAKGTLAFMRLMVPSRNNPKVKPFVSKTNLAPSVISVAEMVSQVGYSTARIGKWHLGNDNQGFDSSSTDGVMTKDLYDDPYATDRIAEASVKFIQENKDKPFFLYTAFFDVHTPLTADKKLVEKYEKKWQNREDKSRVFSPVYAAMIEQVDNAVKLIYDKINELGLSENTLIIFASDNGGVNYITDNSPLRAGKGSLYEGGIRTPAFAVWKNTIKAKTKTSTPIHGLDLMPTLAELSGANLPTNQPVDGISIVPLLKGKKLKERALFWHFPMYLTGRGANGWSGENILPIYGTDKLYWRSVPSSAIQKAGWKLIHFYEYDSYELYNLNHDLSETTNLAEKEPKKLAELKSELEQWLKETKADIPTELNPNFDPNFKGKKKQKK